MARKLRLESEGAIYHVIAQGNYRGDVFATDATKASFLKCRGEACEKAGWVIHAWCVTSNHYHLCLQTPQPNLVSGMWWLQATFSVRFNRMSNERGHVFQGRYKALPVEGDAVGAVCHYIHLNPVGAGLVPVAQLGEYPWTSLVALMGGRDRPAWLTVDAALEHAGGLKDTAAGRRRYLAYLDWLQQDEGAKKQLAFERTSTDWAVGTQGFRKELLGAQKHLEAALERKEVGAREVMEAHWEERLAGCLRALGKTTKEVRQDAKGSAWKVAVAGVMKTRTTAGIPWLAQRLNMGSPFRLSRLASNCRNHPEAYQPYLKRMTKCKV